MQSNQSFIGKTIQIYFVEVFFAEQENLYVLEIWAFN